MQSHTEQYWDGNLEFSAIARPRIFRSHPRVERAIALDTAGCVVLLSRPKCRPAYWRVVKVLRGLRRGERTDAQWMRLRCMQATGCPEDFRRLRREW